MRKYFIILFISFAVPSLCQLPQNYTDISLDSIFGKNTGTFVLYNLNDNHYKIYNAIRAQQDFAVHSTSKIFWSIVALEEGIVKDENEITFWDSITYPRKASWSENWASDQTIQSALHHSVNWYYIDLLKKMEPTIAQVYLDKLGYYDSLEIEKLHYFALSLRLKKSAFEQVDFIKRLFLSDLGISEQTTEIVKSALLQKETPDYTLYYKTGMGPSHNKNAIGWVIGCIQKKGDTYFFALNVENQDEYAIADLRMNLIMRTLSTLGLDK